MCTVPIGVPVASGSASRAGEAGRGTCVHRYERKPTRAAAEDTESLTRTGKSRDGERAAQRSKETAMLTRDALSALIGCE